MSIILTRTIFTTVATRDAFRHDVAFFAGEKLRVRKDYDTIAGDGLFTLWGGREHVFIPSDAWTVATPAR